MTVRKNSNQVSLIVQAWDASKLENSGHPVRERASNGLEACCKSVEKLGSQLFPNEDVFPVWHVAARLESMASGSWPETGESCGEANRVISAIVKVKYSYCNHTLSPLCLLLWWFLSCDVSLFVKVEQLLRKLPILPAPIRVQRSSKKAILLCK